MGINWIKISGETHWNGKSLTYKPQVGAMQIGSVSAVSKSDQYFENGELSFVIKLDDPLSGCYLILNHGLAQQIYIGLNFNGFPYGIGMLRNNIFENLSVSGMGSKLTEARDYKIKITVNGSFVHLFVDGVLTSTAYCTIEKSQIAFQFQGQQQVTVKDLKIKRNSPKAFIIMQFTEEFNELYSEVIKPVCIEYELEAIRADDLYTQNLVFNDIVTSIQESTVVIADITPNNPNVYYEVGYSHGIKKPTILLCDRNRDKLPFDLSGHRTIFYNNKISGKSKIEENLRKHLGNMGF